MNSLDNQLTAAANMEIMTGYLQFVTEKMFCTSSSESSKATLTRSHLSVVGPNCKLFSIALENVKSVSVLTNGNGKLFKVLFYDEFSAVVCCESGKNCEQWVCEINKALLQKPLKGYQS